MRMALNRETQVWDHFKSWTNLLFAFGRD